MDKTALIKIMPNSASVAGRYVRPLTVLMEEYGINTRRRQAHFIAQIAQESGELRYTAENLNYSVQGLLKTFRKYFKSEAEAQAYARQPEKIANRVYANRLGNGDERSGDGWRFRGHGLIQLTGRSNYAAYLAHLQEVARKNPSFSVPAIEQLPELLSQPEHAVRSACWFWQKNGLNTLADGLANDAVVTAITRRINGGTNGLTQRKMYFYRAMMALQ